MTTESLPELNNKQKVKGILSFVHMILGNGIIVKSAIVGGALAAGYGGAIYYHAKNPVSSMASDVIEIETGLEMKFIENMKGFAIE